MEWEAVRHFKPEEWGKDPSNVHPLLVHIVDEIRDSCGVPIIIHVAWDNSGHATKSYHYRNPALACDLHFAGSIPYAEQLQLFLMYQEINGIGFYPQWNHKGFHIDLRKPPRLFWQQLNGNYLYYTNPNQFLQLVSKYDD